MSDKNENWEEVESGTVDWGKVGDNISGTLIDVEHGVKTKFGPNSLYSIKADTGKYNGKGGEITIEAGLTYNVWGRTKIFNSRMNSLKMGQKVKLEFTEEKPSDMGNPAKIIKVLTNKQMDIEWLESNSDLAGDLSA